MDKSSLEKLRFPRGRYRQASVYNQDQYDRWIRIIEKLPEQMHKASQGLSNTQLDTPYRPDGWTIRQLIHHVADSHMNAYIRMKLAITEENPTIKPYIQDLWANTEDSLKGDIQISLELLTALHKRWVLFLKSLNEEDFDRTFFHPEAKKNQSIKFWLSIYAWHSEHHLAHITELRKRNDW